MRLCCFDRFGEAMLVSIYSSDFVLPDFGMKLLRFEVWFE